MKLNEVVSRKRAVASEGAGDQLLLLDLDTGNFFDAGPVGGFIWERLDGERSLRDIADEIQQRFKVDAAAAERDLLEFVAQLEAAGLVQRDRS